VTYCRGFRPARGARIETFSSQWIVLSFWTFAPLAGRGLKPINYWH